ncbi:MAG: DUF3078 domain-containing protein [Bacteroidota bacterium]
MTALRGFAFLLLGAVLVAPAHSAPDAQAAADSTVTIKQHLRARLGGSQASFRNWSEGGINSLALSADIDGKRERTSQNWQQTHELRLTLGVVKQDTLEFRKAEDQIRWRSAFKFTGEEGFLRIFVPTLSTSLRTQFTTGFNYKKNPFGDDRPLPVRVSNFFAPATVTQSLGLSFEPVSWIDQQLAIGAKQTIVTVPEYRALYRVSADRNARFEMGIELRNSLEREVFENVNVRSVLLLFTAFNLPDKPDLIWENLVRMKVNGWLDVNMELVMQYDQDVSRQLQLKEVVSLGMSFNLI